MKLILSYPVKPEGINQLFGANPEYYAKFHDVFGNPYKGHDGIDFTAPHGVPVYVAADGSAVYQKDAHGGEGFMVTTFDKFDYNGTPRKFVCMYWHLCDVSDPSYKPAVPHDGLPHNVSAGDILGYADNTGAPYESSGDHLHFGLFPIDDAGACVNPGNGYNGRIDPMPYFDGTYAQDIPVMEKMVTLYQKVVMLLQELLNIKK